MRKMALLVAVVCLISCYGMNAFGQTSHYVGPSAGTTNGAAGGPIRMNNMCSTTYSATAHMCNVDEFVQTASLAQNKALWAQPKFTNCYAESTSFASCYENGLGWDTPSAISASCNEWRSVSGTAGTLTGTVVSNLSSSGFSVSDTEPCSNVHYVACCSPEN
jgi:hypothetical protein